VLLLVFGAGVSTLSMNARTMPGRYLLGGSFDSKIEIDWSNDLEISYAYEVGDFRLIGKRRDIPWKYILICLHSSLQEIELVNHRLN